MPTTRIPTTKRSAALTLWDRLSRLDFEQACKLLGPRAKKLIMQGAGTWDIDIDSQVKLTDSRFRVDFGSVDDGRKSFVTVTLQDNATYRLDWNCSVCTEPCLHVGAAFALLLENKVELGLAAPPSDAAIESLNEQQLIERALEDRRERARTERMQVQAADKEQPWTDYVVTSALSGKTYRIALRGLESGQAFCSCPDFRTNTLGTCKHVMKVTQTVRRRFDADQLKRTYRPKRIAVFVQYGDELSLRWELPSRLSDDAAEVIGSQADQPITNVGKLVQRIAKLEQLGHAVTIYPDAEELIQRRLHEARIAARMAEIRRDPATHPLRDTLLKAKLLPYQLDGIAFAAGAGRAILADDMGLGKTIQGIGVAELLAREAGIQKVLIVCPASLKAQWRSEIHRFCDRDVQLVTGRVDERLPQYRSETFFTVCNYEQVLRDIQAIETVPWDLIVLDEGQRIKNWEAKTTQVVKSLRSRFALVLSGTPLENRLEDLYSVATFIDARRLGPAFRFFHRHRIVEEDGKVIGYKNLDQLRETLRPVLLRRTRESVKLQVPPRTDEYLRIPPTDEQLVLHNGFLNIVAQIVRKPFISEMDLLRLRQALLMCRLACNSTFLVNKQTPAFSSKLEHLAELFDRLFEESDRKVVLFSEWTGMLDLIEPLLTSRKLRFVRLDGSVPQARRASLVDEFQTNSECKLFLTTNAGSTGLNLQAANTVINIDLPWNPAVLDQRIARAHRMGQSRPVQVFILVTEGTLEESLLATLMSKRDLALAALDADSDVNQIVMKSNSDDLKRRLEILLGAKADAPVDESQKLDRAAEVAAITTVATDSASAVDSPMAATSAALVISTTSATSDDPAQRERRERVAAAGGELLGAAFQFLGELVAQQDPERQPAPELALNLKNRLSECITPDESGRQRLTITLPNAAALDSMANALARLLSVGDAGGK
ncbi:MAG: DEAD/DEAH box helicase [Planctomycetaceae bacterium]